MKKIIFYILVALLVVTVGCNDDDNSLPVIKPEKTGTVTIGETRTDGHVMPDWIG